MTFYAFSAIVSTSTSTGRKFSLVMGSGHAASEREARGMTVEAAEELKPDYSIDQMSILEITPEQFNKRPKEEND